MTSYSRYANVALRKYDRIVKFRDGLRILEALCQKFLARAPKKKLDNLRFALFRLSLSAASPFCLCSFTSQNTNLRAFRRQICNDLFYIASRQSVCPPLCAAPCAAAPVTHPLRAPLVKFIIIVMLVTTE